VSPFLGQEIRTLIDEPKPAGHFTAHGDGKDDFARDVPSGVYLYRIQAERFVGTKMLLLH